MNNQLVHANTDGTLTTTSEIIAGGVGIQHKNVLETIRKNQADFEEFGPIAFETRRVLRFLRVDTASPPTSRF